MTKAIRFLFTCAGLFIYSCAQKQPEIPAQLPEGAFPIEYRSHIYISGTIDSIRGDYVFDTGASNLYIDTTHYVNNGFKHHDKFQAKMPGVGEKIPTVLVIRDSVPFRFGSHLYKTNIVPVFQLKPILGDFADGVLGMEYFYNSVLEINYEHEYMKRHKSIDSVNTEGYTQLALTKRDNRLYLPLEVTINDSTQFTGNFLLDLGAGGSVILTRPTAERHQLHNNINNKVRFYTRYGGVGGESTSYSFICQSVRIGDYTFKDVRAKYSTDKTGVMASDKKSGLLGNDLLDRFHLYIDFINNHLYLKPNGHYNDPFDISRLGFSFTDRSETLNAWIVTGFFSGSDAEKAGLQIDDRIVTVDDLAIENLDYRTRSDYFDNADSLKLGIEHDGKLKHITVKLAPVITK
jgi:predicted aspartyl protease